MSTDAHAMVEDDDPLQRRTKRKDAVRLVILILLTDKEDAYLRIVDHVLDLLF